MIKDNITYCDNDDKQVFNTEWSIIHVTMDRPHMQYTALDFCDFKCMLQWTLRQAMTLGLIPKQQKLESNIRRLLK